VLAQQRNDLDVTIVDSSIHDWTFSVDSFDAVVVYDHALTAELLEAVLRVLRPGGRLVSVDPTGAPGEAWVKTLEEVGYARVLVETAAECPLPVGALMRGEKPYTEEHTVDRVRQVASRDDVPRARNVNVLVRQTPNKPGWTLQPDDTIVWEAVAVAGDNETVLLAFSSLPKAVAFMQPAVMAGHIQGVNKVAKYRWDVVYHWPNPIMLNPTDDILQTNQVIFLTVDPGTAEVPDE
jgi:hypothetical protein